MILFLSDLHLGRGTDAESADAERGAVALLRAHEPEIRRAIERRDAAGLYLVGDVFNQFIEYRRLVPKGFVRLQGLLAAWADAGIPVTYAVGNRDPWHLDYFERELGVCVVREAVTARLHGYETYIAHGDGHVPDERVYNAIRPVLRHPWAYRLYRTLTPGDTAFRLACWVARRGDGTPDPRVVDALRLKACRTLADTPADLVVLGHSHRAELTALPGGTYLNPGYWFAERTFGRLDASGPALLRWTGAAVEPTADNNPAAAVF